jgi:NTE family protein
MSLALQGGGAHGAFEWGVLDALLEDGRVAPAALSGVSAGAMNACALASGWTKGGRDGARSTLAAFWRAVSDAGPHNPFGGLIDPTGWGKTIGAAFADANPFLKAAQAMAGGFAGGQGIGLSPYQFNPFNLNPLRTALTAAVDFDGIRKASPVKLFIGATEVLSGRLAIFRETDLSVDHVLASACLPYLFQAVEIDGVAYWDGGFLANPPLWPMFYNDLPRDVLVISVNPFRRATTPHDAAGILDRLNEISFNAGLVAEFRAAAFVNRLVEDDLLNGRGRAAYKPVRLHMICGDGWLDDETAASKFNTDWSFLSDLRDRGREAAHQWLARDLPAVGRHSSVDVKAQFL